ncbi:MAG TPA: hypothetical protein VLT16_02360 [Candidatus Limnocylindrales bacterium]|nr:hypothetical protein [Candidatus Limnocylindrales bacterium]
MIPSRYLAPPARFVHHDAAMLKIRKTVLCLIIASLTAAVFAQQPKVESKPVAPAASSQPGAEAGHTPDATPDTQAMVKETEQVDSRSGKMGLFWWVPVEFWEASAVRQGLSRQQASQYFLPLRDYTLFIVGVGDMGMGGITWHDEKDLRKNITLRDQAGNIYQPFDKVTDEAQGFADLMKPTLKNMLGPLGNGMQFFFFPLKDKAGKTFADPHGKSEFSLLVTDLMSPGTSTYTWRAPLTSLSPPKYCPVGKERLEASWRYCPWHGVKLDDGPSASPAAPAAAAQ